MKTKFWIPALILPLWFASCDKEKPTDYEASEKIEAGADKVAEGAKEMFEVTKEKTAEAAEVTGEKSEKALEKLKEKSAEALEASKEAGRDLKGKIHEATAPEPGDP